MSASPFAGVFFHALGGLAAGSFYLPYKAVRGWAWESYWLVGGVFSWLIAPWIIAWLFCPDLIGTLREAPLGSVLASYLFGVLWGVGGLTFGLAMRYLGLSLGYALALGFCAAFGTILPPLFSGQLLPMATTFSGVITLSGVTICLVGIGICACAGRAKDRALSGQNANPVICEFDLRKGFGVAVFAGVMSACMAFAIATGKPIAQLAIAHGTPPLWQNTPVFVVILEGGLTTNLIWCLALNIRNQSMRDYAHGRAGTLTSNYLLCGVAGVTWYLQFFCYGMGTTQMGRYDFSSWSLHMAFIIVFSTAWGVLFREWHGAGARAQRLLLAGLFILIGSTLLIGLGNWLAAKNSLAADSQAWRLPQAEELSRSSGAVRRHEGVL